MKVISAISNLYNWDILEYIAHVSYNDDNDDGDDNSFTECYLSTALFMARQQLTRSTLPGIVTPSLPLTLQHVLSGYCYNCRT